MPSPEYPYNARTLRKEGSGSFRLFIDEQGRVVAIKTLKSTGDPELDNSSIAALRQWQARPGTKREVDVPVKFTIGSKPPGFGNRSWQSATPSVPAGSR